MSVRMCVLCSCVVGLFGVSMGRPRSTAAQGSARLTMPLVSLRAIALDFDSGRNPIYCYYGSDVRPDPEVHVDSLRIVSSPAQCEGIGVGFISRITDTTMIVEMLHGLIAAHPRFRIVTAFYGTQPMNVAGESVRAARALSLMRGPEVKQAVFGS